MLAPVAVGVMVAFPVTLTSSNFASRVHRGTAIDNGDLRGAFGVEEDGSGRRTGRSDERACAWGAGGHKEQIVKLQITHANYVFLTRFQSGQAKRPYTRQAQRLDIPRPIGQGHITE